MKVLITGGLGYIGGRLATFLREKESDSCLFLTTSKRNDKIPSWAGKFNIVHMNLLEVDTISKCIKGKGFDVIIHLAALNEVDSMNDPELALKVNTLGTYSLLNIANENRIKKFIYFSTIHVYGEIFERILTEDTPTRPFHPYAFTHRAAEDLVHFFNHYYGMKTLTFRLSNGYGYPMDKLISRWSLVFNDLCKQAVDTRKLILNSSGKQHRDFISLYDVIRAVYHFLFVIPDNWDNGIYNLGGKCSMTILDVAKRISEVYKKKYNKEMIEIKVKQDGNSEIQKPVQYVIEKILKTGFTLKGDMDFEIERTLSLCEEFRKCVLSASVHGK